jgi:hypothetical protein
VRVTPRWRDAPRLLAELGHEPAARESGGGTNATTARPVRRVRGQKRRAR